MPNKVVEHHVLWHQLDDDGHVEAVFASPEEELYSEMYKHAQYVASLANKGVGVRIIEGGTGIAVQFTDHAASIQEMTALVVGKPNQFFDKIHFTNLEDEHGHMAVVAMAGDSWKYAADIVETEFETTNEEL